MTDNAKYALVALGVGAAAVLYMSYGTEPTPTPAPAPAPARAPAPSNYAQPSACPNGCEVSSPDCLIKGNISVSSGEKIYHVPGQKYYPVTVINPRFGERWFCTEDEARANGWRRSKE